MTDLVSLFAHIVAPLMYIEVCASRRFPASMRLVRNGLWVKRNDVRHIVWRAWFEKFLLANEQFFARDCRKDK